jgi:hypothetical protein
MNPRSAPDPDSSANPPKGTIDERALWLDYVSVNLAAARSLVTEAAQRFERLNELLKYGAVPEANVLQARFDLTQAKLQVAKLEALAKLIAGVPVQQLTVSLGV